MEALNINRSLKSSLIKLNINFNVLPRKYQMTAAHTFMEYLYDKKMLA